VEQSEHNCNGLIKMPNYTGKPPKTSSWRLKRDFAQQFYLQFLLQRLSTSFMCGGFNDQQHAP
jgi:hypothetical protein